MFLEQISAPRLDVHLCDNKIFYSALFNGIEKIIPCTKCGKTGLENMHSMAGICYSRFSPPDEVGVNMTQEEFDAKYYSKPYDKERDDV